MADCVVKAAGISRKLAPTVGIAVDPRRQNLSEESVAANVERLKAYMARLIVFPRRSGKQKNGDASKDEVKAAKSGETNITRATKDVLPIENVARVTEGKLSDYEATENAYMTLRRARSDARLVGVREKRAKAKAEEAGAAKK